MAAVDNTAGVEMKEDEGSCRSSHPHAWPVGGACNARLQIWQIWRKRKSSRSEKGKGGEADLKTKLKPTCLLSFFGLQVTTLSTANRKAKISPRSLDFTAAREPTRRQWRWRVDKTRCHCSHAQQPSSTVPEAFFCNYQTLIGVFRLLLFDLFWTFVICKSDVWENHNKKRCVCVFVFLFMLLNYKNKKDRIKCLIWIWLNILRINKIMLYFPWKI